jgi:hypothetical protein
MELIDFIAAIKTRNLARANKYSVELTFPTGSKEYSVSDPSHLTTLFCSSVSIPGLNISTAPYKTIGEDREFPYDRTFEPIQTNFYLDAQLTIFEMFKNWLYLIINPITKSIGFYDDYVKDFVINIISVDGNIQQVITIHEAYPKSIGELNLSSDSNEILTLNVAWQYKYWTSSPGTSSSSSTSTSASQTTSGTTP